MATTANATKPPVRVWSSFTSPESTIGRLVIAPVLFVSFIVSLLLIDRKTSDKVFGSSASSAQSPSSPNEQTDSSKKFYHSHQKKLARREFEDAFQLRGKVIAGMAMAAGVGVAFVGWSGMKMWSGISR